MSISARPVCTCPLGMRPCSVCEAPAQFRCSICKAARYCSEACTPDRAPVCKSKRWGARTEKICCNCAGQREDWVVHRQSCPTLRHKIAHARCAVVLLHAHVAGTQLTLACSWHCRRRTRPSGTDAVTAETHGNAAGLLPDDVLGEVFACLDAQSLAACSSVCKSWRAVAASDRLWAPLLHSWVCRNCLGRLARCSGAK
jgi:hypothetical protein